MKRMILHLDMDAFFASVEQLDHPELRGLPVVVGGDSDRGVVSACSYEARKFGVHSAMPMVKALKLCPQAVVQPGSMRRYAEVSRQVMEVLHDFSPVVEQASVDEAYLDVSGAERLFGPPEELGGTLKAAVKEAVGLNCSVGIAPVKFLAKIASDWNKPDGLFVLRPEEVENFLRDLPVGKIPGVGKRSLDELHKLGVKTCADVWRYPESFWLRRGKAGVSLWRRAQGVDERPVEPYTEAKSESAENTFDQDTADKELLARWLLAQSERVAASLRKHKAKGRTITIKVKYEDFTCLTRSRSLGEPTNATQVIYETAVSLLHDLALARKVRLIGVGVSNFGSVQRQLSLYESNYESNQEERKRQARLDQTIDSITERFGRGAVTRSETLQLTNKVKWRRDA